MHSAQLCHMVAFLDAGMDWLCACLSFLSTAGANACRAPSLQKLNHRIEVPRSVPSLVTDRLLVMNFLEGVPITRLERHTQK